MIEMSKLLLLLFEKCTTTTTTTLLKLKYGLGHSLTCLLAFVSSMAKAYNGICIKSSF